MSEQITKALLAKVIEAACEAALDVLDDDPPPPPPLHADHGGPYEGVVGKAVEMDGRRSTGKIVSHEWQFGDGQSSKAETRPGVVSHTYRAPQTYPVALRVESVDGFDVQRTHIKIRPVSPPPPPPPDGRFAAPDGRDNATGTWDDPWSFHDAVSSPKLTPGDTVYLRGGRYVLGRPVLVELRGEPGNPITFRPYEDEHVALDFVLPGERDYLHFRIVGQWTEWRDIEFFNSDERTRVCPLGDHYRRGSIEVTGHHIAVINCVIHDLMKGLSFWSAGHGGLAYGNLIYNCGTEAPDRAHGPGMYCQNTEGDLLLQHNIVLASLSLGMQIYGSAAARLNNITIDGNITAHNRDEMLFGGGQGIQGGVVRNNVFFGRDPKFGTSIQLDFEYPNHSLEVTKNKLYNCEARFDWNMQGKIAFRENTIAQLPYMDRKVVRCRKDMGADVDWDNNKYYAPWPMSFAYGRRSKNWDQWKTETAVDSNSTWSPEVVDDRVHMFPNMGDEKLTTVVVTNWSQAESVTFSVPWPCQAVHVYDRQTVVANGDGTITLPMRDVSAPAAIGHLERPTPVMPKEYGIFFLRKIA